MRWRTGSPGWPGARCAALGVGDGDRVAMLALNSDRYNEYLLAVPWANAVLNPVNFRWSVAEIAYALRDSASRVLLVDDMFAPMLPALRAGPRRSRRRSWSGP